MAAFEDLAVPAAFCAGVLEAAVLADDLSFWALKGHGSAGLQRAKKQEAGLEPRGLLQQGRGLRQSSNSSESAQAWADT